MINSTPSWLPLAQCPDCGGGLAAADEAPRCVKCSRQFDHSGHALVLLPKGMEIPTTEAAPPGRSWRSRFVRAIYTRHNDSRRVVQAVASVLSRLGPNDVGLNLGSGDNSIDPRLVNLDVRPAENVAVVATAERLPFADAALACVVSQEVFEHLRDPFQAAREVARVLRPGGLFYLQTPFIIGFHSAPHDYWRFTHRGLNELLTRAGFRVLEISPAVGAGTSLYRISVEFAATLAATLWRPLYMPTKAVAAVVCAPLRWLDFMATRLDDTNRINAGFFAIAQRADQ